MLNHKKIVEDELYKRLWETDGYVPLVLHTYLDPEYWNRATEQAKQRYYLKRTQLQGAESYGKFLQDDLLEWIKEHKEFKDIIING